MSSSVFGAITGGILGAFKDYEDKREADRREAEAKRQAEEAKRLAQEEEQARKKAEHKSPDMSGLLEQNTSGGLGATNLTGGNATMNPNRLGGGNTLLGQ